MLFSVLKDIIASRRRPPSVQDARGLLEASRHREAMVVLESILKRNPNDVDALFVRGIAARGARQFEASAANLTRAVELKPDSAQCMFELAHTLYATGDRTRAFELCQRARNIDPLFAPARWLQAQITLDGEYYFQVLERIHAALRPATYVEIGVFLGESLRLAKAPTVAIGVDPDPKLNAPLAPNQRVFVETSDHFFAQHDLREELGGKPVELAFIDGMHQFEFALRDFINLERFCTKDSTILIHDCYPLDRETAGREQGPVSFWSGDIWRLIVLLKKYRPDLSVNIIGAPPTGLGVVRGLDPDSRVLAENYDRLCEEFLQLDYAFLDDDKARKLSLVKNDWANVRRLLGLT